MLSEAEQERRHVRRLRWGMVWLAVFTASVWGLMALVDAWRAGR